MSEVREAGALAKEFYRTPISESMHDPTGLLLSVSCSFAPGPISKPTGFHWHRFNLLANVSGQQM